MSDIESPCVRNCCLNDDDICLGCFRSLEEITQWGESNSDARTVILEHARQRQKAHYLKVGIALPAFRSIK